MTHDFPRHWRYADKIAKARNRFTGKIDDVDRMWALFQEAVRTARSYPSPPRLRLPSRSVLLQGGGVTYREQVAAYLSGDTAAMPETRSRPPVPNAEQHTRSEAILWLFHSYALTGRSKKKMYRDAIHDYAGGVSAPKLRRKYGLSKYQVERAKQDAMADMVRGMGI